MWLDHFFDIPPVAECYVEERKEHKAKLAKNPNDLFTLKCMAMNASMYADREMFEEYAERYLAIEAPYMDKEQIYFLYGRVNLMERNYEKALEWYFKSEKPGDREEGTLYNEVAATYAYMKNFEEAEKYLKVVLVEHQKEYPGDVNFYWQNMGRLLGEMGRNEEALEHFQAYLGKEKNDWYTLYCVALCYQRLGDDLRAIGKYYEALKINPSEPNIYNNLGAIAFEMHGKIPEAIEHMKKGLELVEQGNPVKFAICQNLYKLHTQLSNVDEAEHYRVLMFQSLGFPIELIDPNEDGDFL